MNEIIGLRVLSDYHVWLKFKDGEERVLNLRPYIGQGFTKELLRPEKFSEVFIDEGGGIAWPNGYDFCPNFLRNLKSEQQAA